MKKLDFLLCPNTTIALYMKFCYENVHLKMAQLAHTNLSLFRIVIRGDKRRCATLVLLGSVNRPVEHYSRATRARGPSARV